MRNLKLVLQYDGTDFHGWQQQHELRTVQGTLDRVIAAVTGQRPTTLASGRTDAGVHALAQVVSFRTTTRLELDVLNRAFNALLPADMRVIAIDEVPPNFHATLHASGKRYRYQIDNSRFADPFLRRFAWHQPRPLDAEAMQAAGQALVGTHDFRSFETQWPNRATSVRTIFDLEVRREQNRVLVEVEADGFLYNMVRSITGSLTLIGKGNRESAWLAQALRAMDRKQAGPTAPPEGLFLLRVDYPPDALALPAQTQGETF